MGPRDGLDGRKISSPLGFDPGPYNPWSVAKPTELPGPQNIYIYIYAFNINVCLLQSHITRKK